MDIDISKEFDNYNRKNTYNKYMKNNTLKNTKYNKE